MKIPKNGTPRDELLARMEDARSRDADWRHGKTWSLVYFAGDDVTDVLKAAYTKFFSENGLSPMAFQSLRTFEAEVVAIAADLLGGGDEAAGSMTSGGSESILMAVKTARDRARVEHPHVTRPEMLLPITVHPAFEKAAHYFSLTPVHVPVGDDYRVDLTAARAAITDNTVLIVGSAPNYPYGVIDPIPELAAIARERNISCHVDACLGGFLLPFLRRLGEPVPPFDFSVPGVTSMSADVHKYGFAAKGASTVLYRDREIRKHQFFVYPDWPGGLYGSPTMTGTRPGGAIAAAWAVLNYLGEEGYLNIAREIREITNRLIDGINAIPDLTVRGTPQMSVFAFGSDTIDIYDVADRMERHGWNMDRLQRPPNLHLMITPTHKDVVGPFLADLAEAAAEAARGATEGGTAAMYGALGTMPDRGRVGGSILSFMDGLDRIEERPL
ncbi:MAG: aspartate aminotransferase family protein [Dehalococcoidia bacterium]